MNKPRKIQNNWTSIFRCSLQLTKLIVNREYRDGNIETYGAENT